MRMFSVVAAVMFIFLMAVPVMADGVDIMSSSLNNLPARPLPSGIWEAKAGARLFGSGDIAFSTSLKRGFVNGWNVDITLNTFNADNEGTFNGIDVKSRWLGLEFALDKSLFDSETWAAGIRGAIEFKKSKAIIETSGVATIDNRAVGSIAIPIAYNVSKELNLEATPKVVFFRSNLIDTSQNDVEGYGTVFGVALGGRYQALPYLTVGSDITPILSGDNSKSNETGEKDRTLIWSASAFYSYKPGIGAEVFVTNASGTSVATSLIGASGGSIFGGVNLVYRF